MSLGTQLAAELPFLRRYARALAGSQVAGDAQVRALLETALADGAARAELGQGRIGLYHAFSRSFAQAHASAELAGVELAGEPASAHERAAQERLSHVPPLHRQALLLSALEEFAPDEIAAILGLPENEVDRLLEQAAAEVDAQTATDVLIIEDEPLISMQLETLVGELGHTLAGTAATREQALALFTRTHPGLVLADIQLADGSSGIDAVEDILQSGDVPVIFITAFPEKLLTGERPEPTYLVTKPFQEQTVRVAISQALFFGSSRPVV